MGAICGKSRTKVTNDQIQRETSERALALSDAMGPGLHCATPTPAQELRNIEARRSLMLSIGSDPGMAAHVGYGPYEIGGFDAPGLQMMYDSRQFQSIDSVSPLPTLTEDEALESLMCSRSFRSNMQSEEIGCLDGVDPPGYEPSVMEEAPPIIIHANSQSVRVMNVRN